MKLLRPLVPLFIGLFWSGRVLHAVAVSRAIIGIKVGNTASTLAIYWEKNATLGEDVITIPSWVSFTPWGIYVGAVAKEIYPSNPQNTVFDLMRLLGRPFSEIRDQAQDWPFDVIEHAGLAMIVIYGYQGNRQYVPPEEVLALLLVDLYLAAQRRFGIQPDTVFEATLALPPHLSSKQRELVLNAAEMAGLKIIGCVEEPIASAIAYRYEHQSGLVSEDLSQAKGDLLVYDFGGGALDVSVVGMSDFPVVKAATTTPNLGGLTIDDALAQNILVHCPQLVYTAKDQRTDQHGLWELRRAAEAAKISLSRGLQDTVVVLSAYGLGTCTVTLTQFDLEKATVDVMQRCAQILTGVVARFEGDWRKDMSSVAVITGGSSGVPFVEEIVRGAYAFDGVHKIEASTAKGAALHGALLFGLYSWSGSSTQTLPFSLGVETAGGTFTTVISCNTSLPAAGNRTLSLAKYKNQEVYIRIFAGNRPFTRMNQYIGDLLIPQASESPEPCFATIELQFQIDVGGMLTIQAEQTGSGNRVSARFKSPRSVMEIDPADVHCPEEELYAPADHDARERLNCIHLLQRYLSSCRSVMRRLNVHSASLTQTGVHDIEEQMWRIGLWLNLEAEDAALTELQARLAQIRKIFSEALTVVDVFDS